MSGRSRNCGNCGSAVVVALGRVIECHGAPPTPVPVQQHTPMGVQVGFVCMWPQMHTEDWCAAWVEKPIEVPKENPSKIHLVDRGKPNDEK